MIFCLISDNNCCPANLFEFYLNKLSPDNNSLWQWPWKRVNYGDPAWYMPRPVGHNLLETFMKTLSVSA